MTVSNRPFITNDVSESTMRRRKKHLHGGCGGSRFRRHRNIYQNHHSPITISGIAMNTLTFVFFSLAILLVVVLPMSSLLLSSSSLSSSPIVDAKEIVATNEWQIVEEGDTIPAGLHVRMDLETGTKWAKLIDPNEDDQNNNEQQKQHEHVDVTVKQGGEQAKEHRNIDVSSIALSTNGVQQQQQEKEEVLVGGKSNIKNSVKNGSNINSERKDDVKITRLTNTQIDPDSSAKITNQLLKQAQQEQQRKANFKQSISSLNDFEGDMSAEELDYETMYRALMSLPEEDRIYLNIPEYPLPKDQEGGKGSPPLSAKEEQELEVFIAKITQIWDERQNLLRELEEEYMANVPDIIHSRITSIKEYISSPLEHLKDIIGDGNPAKSGDDSGADNQSMNIIEVLEDLEFHLMDIDMARDFHTMGGWPLLVSLLTDSIHGLDGAVKDIIVAQNNSDATSMPIIPEDQQLYIQHIREATWKVQSLASWCIGTAVKNVEEFHSWGLEDLSDLVHQTVTTTEESEGVSVISILLNRLEVTTDGKYIDPWLLESSLWLKMKQKDLYALGGLLRGNKHATYYFNSIGGPSTLSHFFQKLTPLNENNGSSILNNSAGIKLLSRIMMLGVDLLADLSPIENDAGELIEGSILESLTTQEWCSMPMKILSSQSTNIQRQAIEAMIQMSAHCDFANEVHQIETLVDDPEIRDLLKTVESRAI